MRRLALSVSMIAAACGGTSAPGAPDAPPGAPDAHAGSAADAAPGAPDAPYQVDGTPTRQACTSNFGNALTAAHGRLDGYLVALVPSSQHGCNADSSHLHLQVKANGAIYDVAINVQDPADVDYLAQDRSLPDGPWSEGWHPGSADALDYPQLGLHASDFTPTPQAALETAVENELANANHVSIFMTGYGPDGGHEVHRRGSGLDGAVVIDPLGQSRMLMFHFANQTF